MEENIKNSEGNKLKKEKNKRNVIKEEMKDKPDRGIDTVFRVTLGNHTQLSNMQVVKQISCYQ